MKKVLIVAYYFPPIAASGSFRPLGFCRYLEQYDWLPQILTTEFSSLYPPLDKDLGLLSLVPPSIKIHRIAHPNPVRILLNLRESFRKSLRLIWGERFAEKDHSPFLSDQMEKNCHLKDWWNSVKEDIWTWLFFFPDAQKFWLNAAIKKMSKIPSEEFPDAVWATGRPWTGLILGMKLAQHYGVPFFADFRDPWLDNPNSQPLPSRFLLKARSLERRICASAEKVITTTPEFSRHFQSVYPHWKEKFVTVTNGFDSQKLVTQMIEMNERRSGGNKNTPTLDICHCGTVYGARNPYPFLQAIYGLLETKQIRPRAILARFLGYWNIQGQEEWVAHALESEGLLSRRPLVPYEECLQEMARADILLVLQPNSPLQIPSKIYEYISFGKPILVIGDTGATATLVNEHKLGICCPNEVSALKDILLDLLNRQDSIGPSSRTIVEKFHYRTLAGQLASLLNVAG